MDLVVANSAADAAHSVIILLGNGDGTFQPHHDIAGAPNANSIAVGDFNRDGNPDIATSGKNPGNAVYVSLGNGKGGVTAQKVTSNIGLDPKRPPTILFSSRKLSGPTSIAMARTISITSSAAATLGMSCWAHSACSPAMATALLPTISSNGYLSAGRSRRG